MSSGLELETLLIGEDAAVDGVRDASFETAAGVLHRLVLGDLASVVVASRTGIACLGDGGDVDGGVELTVASPGCRWVSCSPLETSVGAVPE